MKAILASPFRVTDAGSHCLLTLPDVPAGNYRFLWVTIANGLGGNGANGPLTIGLGDNFVGSPGGPGAGVLSNCLSQAATLAANGGNSLQIANDGGTGAGASPQEMTTNGTIAGCTQTGSFTLAAPSDVQLYVAGGGADASDVQWITDLILDLEPA